MIEKELICRLQRLASRWERALQRLSLPWLVVTGVLLTLAVSLGMFSPKYWLLLAPRPGSFEWSRALTFIDQTRHPLELAATLEPAMKWRLLPALAGWILCAGPVAAWVIPWAGLVGLLGFLVYWLTVHLEHRLSALLTVILVGTTGGVITVTNFLGINDGWLLLALVAVTFCRHPGGVVAAGLAGPWIDERFLLGLPLAVVCRWLIHGPGNGAFYRAVRGLLPGVGGYVVVRLGYSVALGDNSSQGFLRDALWAGSASITYLPLGWWMGFRAAWMLVPVALVGCAVSGQRREFWALALTTVAALGSVTVLASDYTRSTHILLVLMVSSVVLWGRHGRRAGLVGALSLCLALNLLAPFIWVTFNKQYLVWPAPVEVLRLLKPSLNP